MSARQDDWSADVVTLKEYPFSATVLRDDKEVEIKGWVRLRKELSVGQRKRAVADSLKGETALRSGESRMEYDLAKYSFSTVYAYLAEWSRKDDVTLDAIEALHPDVYEAIEKIVDKHAKEYEPRPQTRQKKTQPRKLAEVNSSSVA